MYALTLSALLTGVLLCSGVHAADKGKPLPKPKRTPSSSFEGSCFDLSPTNIESIDELLLQVPNKRGKSFTVFIHAFNAGGKSWANEFQCAKNGESVTCRGHDDGGVFTMKLYLLNAVLQVESLSFGNPDNEGPVVLPFAGKAARKISLGKVSCN